MGNEHTTAVSGNRNPDRKSLLKLAVVFVIKSQRANDVVDHVANVVMEWNQYASTYHVSQESMNVARCAESSGMGVPAMMRLLSNRNSPYPPFAPPFLKAGNLIIAQTSNILQFLAPKIGLISSDETSRIWAHQLQLTVADFVTEVHDTHHPISTNLYYKDQKTEAKKRAADFVLTRLPKFLDYFEHVMKCNPFGEQFLVGAELSYVDLSLFQMIEGLRYAFSKAMKKSELNYSRLLDLHHRVAKRPRIARYLTSARRIPFNKQGIFRHYSELDD